MQVEELLWESWISKPNKDEKKSLYGTEWDAIKDYNM